MPNVENSSTNWGEILKWSFWGFILLIVVRFLFGEKTEGKSGFSNIWEFLKSLFLWGGTGGNGGTDSGKGNGSGTGTSLGTGSGDSSVSETTPGYYLPKYFQFKEYFGNYKMPTDSASIANFNKLMKALDRIRSDWGSAIVIRKGFDPALSCHSVCSCVKFEAQNGKQRQLYDLGVELRNGGFISSDLRFYIFGDRDDESVLALNLI